MLPENISAFERLLDHNPDADIVWQHIGWDNIGFLTTDLVRAFLSDHPNLYIALRVEERPYRLGSTELMPNRLVDSEGVLEAEWRDLIMEFPDRIMIGSDEFVGISGSTPKRPQSFEETWPILQQLPDDVASMVGRENAIRVYRLDR